MLDYQLFGEALGNLQTQRQKYQSMTNCQRSKSSLFTSVWRIAGIGIVGTLLFGFASVGAVNVRVESAGFNLENTHEAERSKITKDNISRMKLKWVYETVPDTEFAGVETPPLVVNKTLYFPDAFGNLHAVKAANGKAKWVKSFLDDYSEGERRIFVSRNTPVVHGNTLYIGAGASVASIFLYCETTNNTPGCIPAGDGSYLLAINRHNGQLKWAKKIHDHFMSIPTASPVLYDGKIIVTIASYEELISGTLDPEPGFQDSFYRCCRFRGKTVAVDLDGNIVWERFHTPGQDDIPHDFIASMQNFLAALPEDNPRHLEPGSSLPIAEGFYGASSWGKGNPAVDAERGLVLVAPGSNYAVPELVRQCQRRREDPAITPNPEDFMPDGVTCDTVNEFVGNFLNSVVAHDIDTGDRVWAFRPELYDTWTEICTSHDISMYTFPPGLNPPLDLPDQLINCDALVKPDDYGFGQLPMILRDVAMGDNDHQTRDLVAIGQKSGVLTIVDLETGGSLHAERLKLAEGGTLGGFHFGAATDGQVIYMSATNAHSGLRDVRAHYVSTTEEDPDFGRKSDPRLPARISGPRDIRTLVNPAPDVFIDADVEISFVDACDEFPPGGRRDRCQDNEDFTNEFGDNPFKRIVEVITDWRDKAPGEGGSPNTVANPIPENVDGTPGDKILTVRDLSDCDNASDLATCATKTVASFWIAVDAGTGDILWTQRHPAAGYIKAAHTVSNGILYSGAEGSEELFVDEFVDPDHGTVVPNGGGLRYALDTQTGELLFRFHDLIEDPDEYVVGNPAIVKNVVYWGSGLGHYGAVLPVHTGNRLYAFRLGRPDKDDDDDDDNDDDDD